MRTVDKLETVARHVWLAGLGAYGKGWDFFSGKVEEVSEESSKVFDQLVESGEKIEHDLQSKVKEKMDLSARVKELRGRLGLDKPKRGEHLAELEVKVADLTQKINLLVEKKAAEKLAAEKKAAEPKATEAKAEAAPAEKVAAPKKTAARKTAPRARKSTKS